TVLNSATPRLGIVWSPDKKGAWTLHAHAGMFSGHFSQTETAEVRREDGVARVTSTIYNATYCKPDNPEHCDPFSGATPIHSVREYSPHISNLTWAAENI